MGLSLLSLPTPYPLCSPLAPVWAPYNPPAWHPAPDPEAFSGRGRLAAAAGGGGGGNRLYPAAPCSLAAVNELGEPPAPWHTERSHSSWSFQWLFFFFFSLGRGFAGLLLKMKTGSV